MPDLPNRTKWEKKLSRALLAAWAPWIASAAEGAEPDWEKFAKATEQASKKYLDSVKRLAFVLLFIFWNDWLKDWFTEDAPDKDRDKTPREYAEEKAEESRPGKRHRKLGKEVAKTSRERWRELPADPTPEELDDWIETNLGADRADLIAATEVTGATTAGERAARVILENMGLKMVAIWSAERNACDVCAGLHGHSESTWALQFPDGPPSPHPNCRCWLHYIQVSGD